MAITSALVLFTVTWFLVLFVMLPIRLETQGDRDEIVPGTPAGAPAQLNLRKKFKQTTLISIVIWVALCAVILSGIIEWPSFLNEGAAF